MHRKKGSSRAAQTRKMRLVRRPFSVIREWWSQTGSNRRPHACKARALPTELWPRRRTEVTGRTTEKTFVIRRRALVGLGGLEPPTSRLSSARSNQLSYKPDLRGQRGRRTDDGKAFPPSVVALRRPKKKERRRRRDPAKRGFDKPLDSERTTRHADLFGQKTAIFRP